MPHFFITGTDTGIGKTWFSCWLVRSWRASGVNAMGLKPISSGDREDAIQLRAAGNDALSLDEINPIHLREPAAPLVSAEAENRTLDFPALNRHIATMSAGFSHVAVEGVGGWRVPLAPGYEVRDWARDLNLPVVVVAMNRLGVLNHTLLTVESIRASGLTCAGIVLNQGPEDTVARWSTATSPDLDVARRRNAALLRDILGLPVFEFGRSAEASGQVPVWLGGE